jgi:hypothetical protein
MRGLKAIAMKLGVPALERIFAGMPEPHLPELNRWTSDLLAAGVMANSTDGDEQQIRVAINPEYLPAVEDLVDQDLTAFWDPFVGSKSGDESFAWISERKRF